MTNGTVLDLLPWSGFRFYEVTWGAGTLRHLGAKSDPWKSVEARIAHVTPWPTVPKMLHSYYARRYQGANSCITHKLILEIEGGCKGV